LIDLFSGSFLSEQVSINRSDNDAASLLHTQQKHSKLKRVIIMMHRCIKFRRQSNIDYQE